MELTKLNDGYFSSINYDEPSRQLHIKFENGDYIIYYEVAKLDYVGFISSQQMKEFFIEKIEPRFPSKLISE